MTTQRAAGTGATHDLSTDRSRELYERALRVTPGGVNSPVRAMRSVGREHPIMIASATGAHVTDEDGNQFVDWVQSWGALPLGHGDPEVLEAITRTAPHGTSFGASTRAEVELAELVCDLVPCAEQVRFCSSGTEATMSALRLARAATGRDAVLTFSGGYHGHADPFLATGGSGLATLSIPSSPGVPAATAALTLQARYGDANDVRQIAERSRAEGRPLAAIFVEPIAANMGVVDAGDAFLRELRTICDEIGALLVFDEVITGFRLAAGGAQQRSGVTPDLATFGKIIGGGLPVGAFAGRREIMEQLAPVGSVYQAGTLSGNPLAMAAGLAQLRALVDRDAWQQLDQLGLELERALVGAIHAAGAEHRAAVSRAGSLVTLFHLGAEMQGVPANFDDAGQLDTAAFARTHAACISAGHWLPASQFEALFVSTAHDLEMIEQLATTVQGALEQHGAD